MQGDRLEMKELCRNRATGAFDGLSPPGATPRLRL